MNYFPEFADFIDQHLAKQDRSASWLASRLQVSPGTVSRWLNDGTRPGSPEMVARIADVLLIEKAALLIATGYAYQEESSEMKDQSTAKNEPDSHAEKKSGGGIHFYAPPVIHGDVISDSTVHKTTYYDTEGVAIRKDIQKNVQDERAAESSG